MLVKDIVLIDEEVRAELMRRRDDYRVVTIRDCYDWLLNRGDDFGIIRYRNRDWHMEELMGLYKVYCFDMLDRKVISKLYGIPKRSVYELLYKFVHRLIFLYRDIGMGLYVHLMGKGLVRSDNDLFKVIRVSVRTLYSYLVSYLCDILYRDEYIVLLDDIYEYFDDVDRVIIDKVLLRAVKNGIISIEGSQVSILGKLKVVKL